MDRLRRLWTQWQLGAVALLMFALSALAFLVLTALALAAIGFAAWLVAAALGFSSAPALRPASDGVGFLLWTAVIWLPLSVGVVLPDIARIFADRIREIDASRTRAEMAEIMRQKL